MFLDLCSDKEFEVNCRIIEDLEDEDELNTLEIQDKNHPESSNDYSLETFILETQKWNNFVPIAHWEL